MTMSLRALGDEVVFYRQCGHEDVLDLPGDDTIQRGRAIFILAPPFEPAAVACVDVCIASLPGQ